MKVPFKQTTNIMSKIILRYVPNEARVLGHQNKDHPSFGMNIFLQLLYLVSKINSLQHTILQYKIVNNPRFLEAKRFASRTDAYSRFPIAQQGLRNDVPELTVVKEEHFKPKWANQPSAWSPRRIADIASLSLEHWGGRPNLYM